MIYLAKHRTLLLVDIIILSFSGKIKNKNFSRKVIRWTDATNLRVKQIQNIGVFAKENNLQSDEELPNSITGVLELI